MTDAELGDQINEMTSALLHGDDVLWDRLRVLLQERGIAPDDALLLDLFPDDTKFMMHRRRFE